MKREDIKIGGLYIWQIVEIDDDDNEFETLVPVKVTGIDYDADEEDDCIEFEGMYVGNTTPDWIFDKVQL